MKPKVKVNWRAHLTEEEQAFILKAQAAAEAIAEAQRNWTKDFQEKYQTIKGNAERRAARAGKRA